MAARRLPHNLYANRSASIHGAVLGVHVKPAFICHSMVGVVKETYLLHLYHVRLVVYEFMCLLIRMFVNQFVFSLHI